MPLCLIRCLDPRGIPHRKKPTPKFPDGEPEETPLMFDGEVYNFAPAGTTVQLEDGTAVYSQVFVEAGLAAWLKSRPNMNPTDPTTGKLAPRLETVNARQTVQAVDMGNGEVYLVTAGGKTVSIESLLKRTPAPPQQPVTPPPFDPEGLRTNPLTRTRHTQPVPPESPVIPIVLEPDLGATADTAPIVGVDPVPPESIDERLARLNNAR